MRYLTTLVLFVLAMMMPVISAAQSGSFEQLSDEQQAAAVWVSQHNVSHKLATTIVHAVWYYSDLNRLDPHHVLAMIRLESRFNPQAVSVEGARGLMQVIPKWHRDKLAKRNPHDPVVSIEVGTSIMRDCLNKFSGNVKKAHSCYSSGARNYDRLVAEHKRALMRTIIAQLFIPPTPEIVAAR